MEKPRDLRRTPLPGGRRGVTKVQAAGFLLGLTLTFVIVASYVLTWDRRGLSFAPLPLRHDAPAPSRAKAEPPAAASPKRNCSLDIKRLADQILSKLEYPPRRVPDEREVMATDPHLFSAVPRRFLADAKNPCWHEEFPADTRADPDPYEKNLFTLRSKSFKAVCDYLASRFPGHLRRKDGRLCRLRCLPYFYIVGQPKCGTTDLFVRLLLHPEVKFTTMKEPHWWTRKRFGYIRFKDGFQERFPVEDYLDLFDLAAHHIQESMAANSSQSHGQINLITGEASASTMWDNQAWSYLHGDDRDEAEPPFLAQDFIHAVQPDAKIIIMLRDPVERLYSDYLYFKMANKSAEDFHQKVIDSVQLFQSCLSNNSLRSCVYNTTLSNTMSVRLNLGMYVVFLLDWLTVFQREQILVLRLEDYAADLGAVIKRVFGFLGVGPLTEQAGAALTKRPMSNTRRAADRSLGPMTPPTRALLRELHRPFNARLARALDNEAFLWTDT